MAERKILVNLNMGGNQILNVLAQVLATDPASPANGQFWFNSAEGKLKFKNASGIQSLATGGETHDHSNKAVLDQIAQADLDKLDGIAIGANNYTHPATHSMSMITETTTGKIMTDVERTKLAGIAEGANNYTHPSTHSLDMITETTSKKIMTSTERTKLSGIAEGANNYTHPSTHAATIITQDSTHRFATDTEKATWNAKLDASQKGANSGVCELDSDGLVPTSRIPSSYKECAVYATYASLPGTGPFTGAHAFVTDASGDPTVTSGAAEYIWNGTVWVKIAEVESMDVVLSWENITGKPSAFTPATHGNEKHSATYITSSGVTYENLNTNGGVGEGAAQVASGDHDHSIHQLRCVELTTAGNLIYFDGTNAKTCSVAVLDLIKKTSPLSDLGDVTITSIATGEILKWNGTAWVNQTLAEAGIEPAIGTKNTAFNKSFGTAAGTVCQGNDSRLSDARTPVTHGNDKHSVDYMERYSLTLSTSATSYTVSHSLGTKDVIVQVYEVSTGNTVEVGVERYDTSTVKLYFATAPAANAYRVVVIG